MEKEVGKLGGGQAKEGGGKGSLFDGFTLVKPTDSKPISAPREPDIEMDLGIERDSRGSTYFRKYIDQTTFSTASILHDSLVTPIPFSLVPNRFRLRMFFTRNYMVDIIPSCSRIPHHENHPSSPTGHLPTSQGYPSPSLPS